MLKVKEKLERMSSKAATSNAVKDKETDAAMAQLVKEIVTLDALKVRGKDGEGLSES